MISKISELAKNNSKISDFHLRGGSDIACRIMGDIVIEKNSKIENKDIDDLLKNNCSEAEIKIYNTKILVKPFIHHSIHNISEIFT